MEANVIVEDEETFYHLELPIEAVRIIHTGLTQACQKWSGGDPEEQVHLIAMRDNFYRLLLEFQFNQVD